MLAHVHVQLNHVTLPTTLHYFPHVIPRKKPSEIKKNTVYNISRLTW